jgi:hypothetical protein
MGEAMDKACRACRGRLARHGDLCDLCLARLRMADTNALKWTLRECREAERQQASRERPRAAGRGTDCAA